jgi:hypothetical protein
MINLSVTLKNRLKNEGLKIPQRKLSHGMEPDQTFLLLNYGEMITFSLLHTFQMNLFQIQGLKC